MSGAASPSPYTQSVQTVQGGWMANPTARAIGLPILKQQAAYDKSLMDMMVGVNNNDPASLAKFYGLPSGASTADIVGAIHNQRQSPTPVDTSTQQQPVALPPKNPTPTKTAARGGLMSLRGYATGGAPKPSAPNPHNNPNLTSSQADYVAAMTPAQRAQWTISNQAQRSTMLNKAGQGTITPGAGKVKPPTATDTANTTAIDTAKQNAGLTTADAYVPKTYGTDVTTDASGKQTMTFTDPNYNKAVGALDQLSQGTGLYGGALNSVAGQGGIMSQLQGMAGYTPQQVAAQNASAQQASSQGYSASTMGGPQQVSATGYDAAQMQGGPNVNAVNTQAASMAGPASWTAAGTAQQYMDPYIKTALASQQDLSNRQFAQQQNQLKSQATESKAFGGSRAALAQQNAQLNQNLTNQNMAAQGLSQAYQTGMGQFNTAQGQGLQAGQANLGAQMQANLANQQAGMTAQQLNQLYGQGGFQTNQANMAAQNAQMQQYVQNQLAAAQANQGAQLTTDQQNAIMSNAAASFTAAAGNTAQLTNAQLGTQANIASASNALAAQQANQAAGLQANQQGIGALSGIGNMASGLTSTATQIGNYNTGVANLLGQAGGTWQTLGNNIANQNYNNANNIYGGPANLGNKGVDTLQGMGGGNTGYQVGASKTTP